MLRDEIERRLALPEHDLEMWEFEYQVRRYLKNVAEESLASYKSALLKNLTYLLDALRDRGRYSGDRQWSRPDLSGWWLRKFAHISAEYLQRGQALEIDTEQRVEVGGPLLTPSDVTRFGPRSFVVKYGERAWLEELLQGSLRLAPASKFKDGSFDAAREDNELAKDTMMLRDQVTITTESGEVIKPKSDVTHTIRMRSDYWTYCTSTEHDPRLFHDFRGRDGSPGDACAIIFDVEGFHGRLEKKMAALRPGWLSHFASVCYYDPYEPKNKDRVTAAMSKHFSYAYQREHRFICVPTKAVSRLDYLTVELGALDTMVGLYRMDGAHLGGLTLKQGKRLSSIVTPQPSQQ